MKVIVQYGKDKKILRVDSLDMYLSRGKTEEDINTAIKRTNADGRTSAELIEVPENLENIFNFFLGEKEYVNVPPLRSVYNSLRDLRNEIEDVGTTLYDISSYLDDVKDDFKKILSEEDLEDCD